MALFNLPGCLGVIEAIYDLHWTKFLWLFLDLLLLGWIKFEGQIDDLLINSYQCLEEKTWNSLNVQENSI